MKALQKNATISDWVLYGFGKLPIAVSMLSILMSYHTCGTVGLVISTFFYYFLVKLFLFTFFISDKYLVDRSLFIFYLSLTFFHYIMITCNNISKYYELLPRLILSIVCRMLFSIYNALELNFSSWHKVVKRQATVISRTSPELKT